MHMPSSKFAVLLATTTLALATTGLEDSERYVRAARTAL
jgi:hypothetical protein